MRILPRPLYSGAIEGSGGTEAAAVPTEAPAAITTGLESPSVLSAVTEAPAAGAQPEAAPATPPEEKPDETPPAEMKPEDYGELDLPEGISAEDPLLLAFLAGAAKGNMDKESVQAVLGELGPKLHEQLMAPQKAWADMNAAWATQVKTDPVLGGAKLPETLATISSGLTSVLTAQELGQLHEALETTGAGNHPAVVRALHRFASRVTEGGHVSGSASKTTASFADRMYPTHRAAN